MEILAAINVFKLSFLHTFFKFIELQIIKFSFFVPQLIDFHLN